MRKSITLAITLAVTPAAGQPVAGHAGGPNPSTPDAMPNLGASIANNAAQAAADAIPPVSATGAVTSMIERGAQSVAGGYEVKVLSVKPAVATEAAATTGAETILATVSVTGDAAPADNFAVIGTRVTNEVLADGQSQLTVGHGIEIIKITPVEGGDDD